MAMAIDVRYPVAPDPTDMTAAEPTIAAASDLSPAPAPKPAEQRPRRPKRAHRRWGAGFDPDRLALLELRMWQAYYGGQRFRLFGLLVRALREQANASLPRAALAAAWLTKAAIGFARASGDYDRFASDIVRGYRALGLPRHVDVDLVARHELRWWVIRREMGLTAGEAAGESISRLYAAMYDLPLSEVADAGRLRGLAAEVRDRGASVAIAAGGQNGAGDAYWLLVGRLLRESYRSLRDALDR
jgi:hypothetical protein